MQKTLSAAPKYFSSLYAIYFLASLAHFSHNAEYIAFYPNMPASLTRETVYVAWLAVTGVGVLGLVLARFGWHAMAAAVIAAYGALGLDGLAHYTLALCSEHTLTTNVTIWFETITGASLLLVSAVQSCRIVRGATYLRTEPRA